MKKLFVLLPFFASLSAFSQVKVGTSGDIVPLGSYPAVKLGNYQAGSYPVQTIVQRNAIPSYMRIPFMSVYVGDSAKSYRLGNDLNTWTEIVSSAIVNYSTDSAYKYRDTVRAFGNSFTYGAAAGIDLSYPARIDTITQKYHVNNYGISSETSTQILTRLLADNAIGSNRQKATILEMGRNDYTDTTTVLANIATAVNSLGHSRYLILNVFKARLMNEWAGTPNAALIDSINAKLLRKYTYHVVPINEYIISRYNAGIPQDVIDFGHNVPPSSLSATTDSVHRNAAGYDLMARRILQQFDVLNDSTLITGRGVDYAFAYPNNIGYGKPANGNFLKLNVNTDTTFNLFAKTAVFKNLPGTARDGTAHLQVTGVATFSDSINVNLPSQNFGASSIDSVVVESAGHWLNKIPSVQALPWMAGAGSGYIVTRDNTLNVGIGAAPAAGIKLGVSGNMQVNGNVTFVSDDVNTVGSGGQNATAVYAKQFFAKTNMFIEAQGAAGSYIKFTASGTTRAALTNDGLFVGGFSGPTALLHVGAGLATVKGAPFKYTTGVAAQTVLENGAKNFDGTNEYLTAGGVNYVISKSLLGTSTLDFPSTAAQSSSELTITVTGAADGDVVSVGIPNSSSNSNSCFTARVSATNTVTVKFNNYSSAAIDPASGTFNVRIIK